MERKQIQVDFVEEILGQLELHDVAEVVMEEYSHLGDLIEELQERELVQLTREFLHDRYDAFTDAELLELVHTVYPHLLENN